MQNNLIMKNKELINKIQNKIKGDNLILRKPIKIAFDETDVDTMNRIVKDNGEWCLESKTWLLPLTEMTNKELLELRKSI